MKRKEIAIKMNRILKLVIKYIFFLLLFTIILLRNTNSVYATETEPTLKSQEQEETSHDLNKNELYDSLKEKIETNWEKGMNSLNEVNPIEITGNLPERILRRIAELCYRNLKSMKAGSLLIGVMSFVIGSMIALLARKDKKIKKIAIGVCMIAIPSILLVFIFGISGFVSIFS